MSPDCIGTSMIPEKTDFANAERLIHSRVCIVANGCHENRMDAELLRVYLANEFDVKVVSDPREAEFVIVQGCSVTQHMENESKEIIRHLKEELSPHSVIAMGCLSKFRPETIAGQDSSILPMDEIEHNVYRMGPSAIQYAVNQLYQNPHTIERFQKENKERAIGGYFGRSRNPLYHGIYGTIQFFKNEFERRIDVCNQNTFSIKVSTGCTGACSYCSIRLGRGKIKSKPISDIVREFKKGIQLGRKHIALIGTDLGDYGKDTNSDLYELLSRLLEVEGDYKVKLRNVNPRWLIPNHSRFISLAKSRRFVYMQSPIQSGNDRILNLMNRGYASSDFLDACKQLKSACKGLFLRTQIIVGFPTETEEEFNDSKKVLKSGCFDYIDVFRFTKRKGTRAAEIHPDVPLTIIVRRYREIFLKTLFGNPIRKLRALKVLYYDSF